MDEKNKLRTYVRPFVDKNLNFPTKPCLIADLKLFHMPDGLGIQVRGGEATVLLRGRLSQNVIPWLLKALDGTRTVDDLFAQCPEDVKPQQLSRAMMSMFNRGLFAAAPSAPESDVTGIVDRKQLLFFGRKLGILRANESASDARSKLASSRVILLGDGLFGTAAFDILFRSGCTNIDVVDWSGDGFMRDSIASLMETLAAGSPLAAPHLVSRSVDETIKVLGEKLASTDLLVTATTSAPSQLFLELNRQCLSQSVPWLRGNDDGTRYEIGPYVNPYNSGCYHCMTLRRNSASDNAIEDHLYDLELTKSPDAYAHSGEFLAGAISAAGLLIAEAARILTKLTLSSAENCVLNIGADGQFSKDRFIRVPRCPSCYRGRIQTALEPTGQQSRA